jgi:hypothetical protein
MKLVADAPGLSPGCVNEVRRDTPHFSAGRMHP